MVSLIVYIYQGIGLTLLLSPPKGLASGNYNHTHLCHISRALLRLGEEMNVLMGSTQGSVDKAINLTLATSLSVFARSSIELSDKQSQED